MVSFAHFSGHADIDTGKLEPSRHVVRPNERHAVTSSGRSDVTPSQRQAVTPSGRFYATPYGRHAADTAHPFDAGSSGHIAPQQHNNPFLEYASTPTGSSQYAVNWHQPQFTTLNETEMQTPVRVPEGLRSKGYHLNPFLTDINVQHVKRTGARVQFQDSATPVREIQSQPATVWDTRTTSVNKEAKNNWDTVADEHQFQDEGRYTVDANYDNRVSPVSQAENQMTMQKVSRKQLKVHYFDGTTSFDSYLAQSKNASAYNAWNKSDQFLYTLYTFKHMKDSLKGAAANGWACSVD